MPDCNCQNMNKNNINFKVGDRVIFTKDNLYNFFFKGEKGKISERISHNLFPFVVLKDNGKKISVMEKEIRPDMDSKISEIIKEVLNVD